MGRRDYEMSVPRGIAGRSLTYDDEDRLVTVGGVVYEHDTDGFLVSKTEGTQVTTYDYSLRGELLRVDLPDSTVIEYVHDPLGRRIAKKVDGTVTEKYLWQGLTRLLAVYNADDTLKMRFEYADARMPVAMTKDGVMYYLGCDQVGTLKAVADASGNVIRSIEYDAFGNIISDSDDSFAVPFGFAGGLHDPDIGLVRFGYRDYDPETGRWTAKDPILFAGGDTDLYGYCVNDPVNLTDPDGLMVPCDPGAYSECEATCKAYGTSVRLCYKIPILGLVHCKCEVPEDTPCTPKSKIDPNKKIIDQLQGKGQLKDLRKSPNLMKDVNIEKLLQNTPNELYEKQKSGEITKKTLKQIMKAFEGRDLGH